jgi:hypothetical protein
MKQICMGKSQSKTSAKGAYHRSLEIRIARPEIHVMANLSKASMSGAIDEASMDIVLY